MSSVFWVSNAFVRSPTGSSWISFLLCVCVGGGSWSLCWSILENQHHCFRIIDWYVCMFAKFLSTSCAYIIIAFAECLIFLLSVIVCCNQCQNFSFWQSAENRCSFYFVYVVLPKAPQNWLIIKINGLCQLDLLGAWRYIIWNAQVCHRMSTFDLHAAYNALLLFYKMQLSLLANWLQLNIISFLCVCLFV